MVVENEMVNNNENRKSYSAFILYAKQYELEKEIIPVINDKEPWKQEGLDYLYENELLTDLAYWSEHRDEPMPIWMGCLLMKRIHDDLKE